MSDSETPKPTKEPAPIPAPFNLPEEISKHTVRRTVWLGMQRSRLLDYPRICWALLPNFKGSVDAANKLVELEEFKKAKVVKVNPDKPQECVRAAVLKNKKELVVPTPRFNDGFLRSVILDENATDTDVKNASRYKDTINYSKPIDIDTKIDIDLVIMGSVAVDRKGHRIGKGEGFADLEYSVMMHLKAVKPDTIIATTVHDNQVFDSFPDDIFQPFDVPVDIIVTPTQVIRVEKPLPKPTGILWNFLTQRRVNAITILQKLLEADKTAGKDVTLKVEAEGEYPKRYSRLLGAIFQKRPRRSRPKTENQDESAAAGENARPQRRPNSRRRNPPKKDGSGESVPQNGEDKPKRPKRNRKPARKHSIDFSLRVGNVERSVNVKDFKVALAERGVKPAMITRRKESYILHFAKPAAPKEGDEAARSKSVGVNEMIADLQGLKLAPTKGKDIVIEPAKAISRIETTDVTSV